MHEATKLSDTVKAGRLLRLWGWVSLVLVSVIALAAILPILIKGESVPLFALVGFACVLAVPSLYLLIGHYVKKSRGWAKIAGAIISVIFLINVPIGTVIGALTLFYLVRGWHETDSAA